MHDKLLEECSIADAVLVETNVRVCAMVSFILFGNWLQKLPDDVLHWRIVGVDLHLFETRDEVR